MPTLQNGQMLTQFAAKLATNCLNVFDRFVDLALKMLKIVLQNNQFISSKSFLQHHNVEWGYYILFIIFGIIPFTEEYSVFVVNILLKTVSIRLTIVLFPCFFSQRKE